MNRNSSLSIRTTLLALSLCFVAGLASCASENTAPVQFQQTSSQPLVQAVPQLDILRGKSASLSWIFGNDCQRGLQAYLQTAGSDPDLALVGTGWVDPTTGNLIVGHNNCVSDSHSMDTIVQLAHSKGGNVYLTITMDTEGPNAWTHQQAAVYIDKATTTQSYIDAIVQEVVRANYDGVIMDLEGVDHNYPNIRQLFATYNQQLHSALQALHKWYGITLIPKTSDKEDPRGLSAFEDWHLLAHTADFLVIMALDESYLVPGPTVSLPWLNQLMTYALQMMPDILPNIVWELPLYGATWHQENKNWVYDGQITFRDAQDIVDQLSQTQVDASASNLQDPSSPHIVYTDDTGIKHALWYSPAKSLYSLVTDFWQMLEQEPQFGSGRLQIAVWWRTTQEPLDFWPMLDGLYHT